MKDIDKFPSIENVHEVLSDLTGLFDDRNKLLDTMFREDKYKDFLLAEYMQQLAEADKRDDSANGRIKKDLANGYEVLKAKTTMKKFANFISPGSLPPMDLTETDDFSEDDDYEEEEAPVEKEAPEKGEKGDKGDDGADGADAEVVKPDKPKPKSRVFSWQRQQTPKLKLAEGGAVAPSPMMNSLTPQAGQRPEGKSGVKSLESLGLVGKKNVASELTEDLGLEEYKKALADAMALPLKAVAAGLTGLLENVEVPGGGDAGVKKQVGAIAGALGVQKPTEEGQTSETTTSEETSSTQEKSTKKKKGWFRNLFGKKKKGKTEEEFNAESAAYDAHVQKMIDPYGSDETMDDYSHLMGKGGPSHDGKDGKVAPDQISTTETMHLLCLRPGTADMGEILMYMDSTKAARQPGGLATYRIHDAHASSTSTDVTSDPFVPPRWRPFDPSIAQVPYTFPPRKGKAGTRGEKTEETGHHPAAGAGAYNHPESLQN